MFQVSGFKFQEKMLSIIVTHHQTPVLLKLCLKSIQENIGDISHEIIIIDSKAESKNQKEIQEQFPKTRFLSFEKNLGYAKLVNAGLRQSAGEYILILNADIIVLKEAVQTLLRFMKEHRQVGIVGPQLLTFTNKVQDSCFRFPTLGAILARRTFLGKLKWGKRKIKEFVISPMWEVEPPTLNVGGSTSHIATSHLAVDWLQGSAMMVRQAAVGKVGFLDERFFMYLEDADWCRRFWQNDWLVIYLPAAQMAHYYYRTSQKWGGALDILFNKYTRLHLISALKYFWKWHRIN